MTMKKGKKLRPYIVRVRVIGEWWEEYEVEAASSSDAWDDWMDDDVSYKTNDDPIGLDALEWEVYDVKPDYWEDDDEYDDD